VTAPAEPVESAEEQKSPIVFDDFGTVSSATRAAPSRAVSELASGNSRNRRSLDRGFSVSRGLSRNSLTTAVAIVVVVAVVATAVSLASSGGKKPSTAAGGSTATTAPRSGTHHHTKVTTPSSLQPTTASTAEAAYSAPLSTYTLQLVASGPCWILASEPSTGAVLWTGTLQAGDTKQIPAAGTLLVRLGAAFNVTVTLNGEPVVLPSDHGSPYNLNFQPV
jgi:hypothetical protein